MADRDENTIVTPDSPLGQKLLAEAEKFKAEAEVARGVVKTRQAEAKKFAAEAEKLAVEARSAAAFADSAEIELTKRRRTEKEELAANKYYHVYDYSQPIGESSVDSCINTLTMWNRLDPGCDVDIVFYSPGGSVLAGMKLFDFVSAFRKKGHFVRTKCLGMAASMAGILLQAGDERIIGKESYVLIHEISAGAVGKIGELEDQVKFINMIQDRVLNIFASRAKVKKSYFKSHWLRKDWWLNSDECLKLGVVDRVE